MTTLASSLPFTNVNPRDGIDLVRRAADWGYEAVWASEVDGPDAFSQLGALAVTTDLDLGVAVVPVQTRTTFVLGMTAVSLQELSGGRFSLGIGASSEVLVERFGGVPFTKPLTHVRETVEALRPILHGERSTFDGDKVTIGGYKSPVAPSSPVPLYLGSLNPASLRLAGAVADGVCLNQMSTAHLPTMLAELRKGAQDAGRDLPDDFPVVARLFCLVTDQPEAAKQLIPHVFAPYVATTGYNRFYSWMGYEEEAAAIAKAATTRDKAAMAEAYTPDIVDALFCIGDADTVTERIREFVDAGVTVPVIQPLEPGLEGAERTLRAIADRWG